MKPLTEIIMTHGVGARDDAAGGCLGKLRYASAREAVATLRRLKDHGSSRRRPLEKVVAYRCDGCGFWHLGNTIP